jgi:hypothetical protein
VPIYDGYSNGVRDDLYLTCTAVSDGTTTALLMSADMKGIAKSIYDKMAKVITDKFKIPAANIIISATHTHSAPTAGSSTSETMKKWHSELYVAAGTVAEKAIADLAPAEVFVGTSQTENLTFVRRYKLSDGTYQTNPSADRNPIEHESEADNELRTVRFERGKKKDILMVNYQTHYGYYEKNKKLSADFVWLFRDQAEEKWGSHFVYYSGASGNLNFNSALPGERIYKTVPDGMVELMNTTADAIASEQKVKTGKVRCYSSLYAATVLKDSAERVAQAKEINALKDSNPKKAELMTKYGMTSRMVQGIVTRAGLGKTQSIPFHGISFGDVAFSTSPIEQFDFNALQVRDASPFKMTFTCSMTNGSYGYVPTAEAFPHGAYEVLVSRYVPGSGEEFAKEQLRLLNLCKKAG